MNDNLIRVKVHQAVDAYSASMQDDPFLAQRILTVNRRKEVPRMKKLSTGMIIAIVLMLLSVTAVAVGLSIEQVWQQAFDKMGTWGEVWNIGEPTEEDLTMEEAAAIGRKTIKEKFGVTDEELDAMGFYPSYFEAEVDDGTYYPADWRFLWSSKTNADIAKDDDDHGPNGEYRVYMDAITGEIETCIFYTTDFWRYAQRIWDVGNYEEVYRNYKQTDFFNQPDDVQAYWTKQLAEKGYVVRSEQENLHQALLSAQLELQFNPVNTFADNSDPLVAAAWAALEKEFGLDADLLRKYAYVATIPGWNTGYDDVCIHFSYELEWAMMEAGFIDQYSDWVFGLSNRLGLFMVSFEKGTTNVAAITHVKRSDYSLPRNVVTEGTLLARTDWTAADLGIFNEEYEKLNKAVMRMRAAKLDDTEFHTVMRDYFHRMGVESEYYPAAPEEANVMQWFQEESEWDEKIVVPTTTYEQFTAQYGRYERFWPQEVMISLDPRSFRMPNEGETTFETALARALDQLAKERGTADLTGYTINIQRVSLTADPNEVDCRWQVFVGDDPKNVQKGWKIHFGEWEDHIDTPFIQDIMDPSNG